MTSCQAAHPKKLQTVTSACNLVQVISEPTSVFTNSIGMYWLYILTNAAEICSKAVSKSIGCIDNNIVAISRKTKVPKAEPNIMYKRSYKKFCSDFYVEDLNNMCLSVVCNEEQPDTALEIYEIAFSSS